MVSAKSLQSCPTLCDLMDCSLLGSSVHRILQARILEWVAMPSSRGSLQPRDQTRVSCITGGFFTAEPLGSLIFFPVQPLGRTYIYLKCSNQKT